jgi:cation diffusion facilitator family transporter
MVLKFTAWYLTKSTAILSDALESIVNIVASGFALYSLKLASRPKDENHPYGHGKIEFISVGLEGMFIFIAGLAAIIKGIYTLFHPYTIGYLPTGLAITAGAGLANFGLARMLLSQGKALGSKTMQADGKHLLADVYSSISLIIGLTLVYFTQLFWFDSVLAILFGGLIIKTGYTLLRDSIGGIMDETDVDLVKRIVEQLNRLRRPNWIDLHNLRIQRFGNRLHVDCHVTLPYYFSLQEAHDELDILTEKLSDKNLVELEFFIHSDPCEPPLTCQICTKEDCPVRQAPFQKHIDWSLASTIPNQKHSVHTST